MTSRVYPDPAADNHDAGADRDEEMGIPANDG